MEEWVGERWHRLITRVADNRHPDACVHLTDIQNSIGVFFRALGGDGGLQVELSDPTVNRHRRSRLQRFAGVQSRIHLAWRDKRSLRLPPRIAWFDEASLNRDLYFWLAALAAAEDDDDCCTASYWIEKNRRHTQRALQQFPGLGPRYRRLVDRHLAQRPDPDSLQRDDAASETIVRNVLRHPEHKTTAILPLARVSPVPLWLHPEPPLPHGNHRDTKSDDNQQRSESVREPEDIGRRQAEQIEEPEKDRGLVAVRMENIFTLGEFVNVDRGSEEEDDCDRAEAVARDLDKLSVSKNGKAKAGLKFDLDLPSAGEDDAVLQDGLRLPEWDWKAKRLKPDRCRVVLMQAEDAPPRDLPAHLVRSAKKLRNQFQALVPARTWHDRQSDGQDIDLDGYIRFAADRAAGIAVSAGNLYRELRSGDRDLCCLLLADLSLSTDTWIDNRYRIIDVIRDSLYLFGESLHATGDRFSLYGFSSRKRDPIRVHAIKSFNEDYGASIRGRIDAIKPGYYTRLGAGIRFASRQLMNEGNGKRLLLVLTDGKPNDLDQYEGRYGIEDTRQAVVDARHAGLLPFCVTIDRKGNEYLPHIFGKSDFVVIRDPKRLPKELPRLYSLLTQ